MKKKSIIDYIIKMTDESYFKDKVRHKKKASNYERLHIKVDDQIKYCLFCNRAWRKNRKMYTLKYEYYPQNHIPSIGKEKKQCPRCKEKQ